MKIGRRFKVIMSVLVFMSLFYICMPALCFAKKTEVTAHISPISDKPTDSDDNMDKATNKKSPKDKKAVGTGDNLLSVCFLIMSAVLSMLFIVILFLKYYKTED